MKPIIYTISRHEKYGDYIATVLPGTSAKTEEVHPFVEDIEALHHAIKKKYGDKAMSVSSKDFQTELEQRMIHTPEMLAMLQTHVEGNLSNSYVYGSCSRPMSSVWVHSIPNAIYIPANKQRTGYYTYVVSSWPIASSVIEHHNLEFISRPAPDMQTEGGAS